MPGCGANEIASRNEPFWNVRTLDSAIEQHDGYVSYPLWWNLHQFLLDDVICRGEESYLADQSFASQGERVCRLGH